MQVNTVVFDKTGTLTVGRPAVVSAKLFPKFSMEELCDMTVAAEVGHFIWVVSIRNSRHVHVRHGFWC